MTGRDRLEKQRRAQGAAAPAPAKPEAQAVTFACGHSERGTPPRKADATKPCPKCRQVAHEARMASERAAAKARRAEKAARKRDQKDRRLPDGSHFDHLRYDAATTTWSGSLTV